MIEKSHELQGVSIVSSFKRRPMSRPLTPDETSMERMKMIKCRPKIWAVLVDYHRTSTRNPSLDRTILELLKFKMDFDNAYLKSALSKSEKHDRCPVNSAKEVLFEADTKLCEMKLKQSATRSAQILKEHRVKT